MARIGWTSLTAAAALAAAVPPARAQDTTAVTARGDSVLARFVDADLRTVAQALARFLEKPVLMAALPTVRVSLETPAPVARDGVLPLLRGLLETQNLELHEDTAFFRVQPRAAEPRRVQPR